MDVSRDRQIAGAIIEQCYFLSPAMWRFLDSCAGLGRDFFTVRSAFEMTNGIAWEGRQQWKSLVTPQYTRKRPKYNWFLFPHSFDKILVEDLLHEMNLGPGAVVWDPFLGAGTTILACCENGVASIGTDLLPLSVIITQAKTTNYDPSRVMEISHSLNYQIRENRVDRFADIPIVAKAIPSRIRIRISSLLGQIEQLLDRAYQPLFLTALISILEDVSYSVKSGGWLRIDSSKSVYESDVKRLFSQKISQMVSDLHCTDGQFLDNTSRKFWLSDARYAHLDVPVDGIITSPPYLNRHDYTRVFALELALIGVSTAEELKQLRYSTLRSHVEARSPKVSMTSYQMPQKLAGCIKKIGDNGVNDRRVLPMIRGYFEDLFLVLQSAYRNLATGGKAAFVLGDVRFSGTVIPVAELALELGTLAGLTPEKAIIARYRGNSSQQMGTFGREEIKECVILFSKP